MKRPGHEHHLATATGHPRRSTSRRTVIAASAIGLGAGLLAPLPTRDLLAQRGYRDEIDALDVALAIEQLHAALYREGLERFDDAAFADAGLPANLRSDLATIRDQEMTHLDVLSEAIADFGGAPSPPAAYAFGYDDLDGFLDLAAALETTAVAAYAGVVPAIDTRRVQRTLLGLHSVEARHAAYLNALTGRPPFPDAVDAPLGRAEALAAIRAYAAAGTPADGASTPVEEPPDDRPAGEPAPGDPDARRFAPVLEDAAARLGVPIEEVSLVRVEERTWPDASLGCPQPGNFYAQVITPGYLVVVAAGGDRLEYHTDDRGTFVLCS